MQYGAGCDPAGTENPCTHIDFQTELMLMDLLSCENMDHWTTYVQSDQFMDHWAARLGSPGKTILASSPWCTPAIFRKSPWGATNSQSYHLGLEAEGSNHHPL